MNKVLTIEGLLVVIVLSFLLIGGILIIRSKYGYKFGRSPKQMLDHSEDIDLSKDAED